MPFFGGGKFKTLFFSLSILAHRENRSGKNSGTPCIDLTIGVATSVALTVQCTKVIRSRQAANRI